MTIAKKNFDVCRSINNSPVKAENVVSPPRKPIVNPFLTVSDICTFWLKSASKIPVKQAPNKFDARTPYETVFVNGFRRMIKEKRSSEPETAPIATNIIDESVKETPS